MEEIAHRASGNLIPRFRTLRRVPVCYRRVLPLKVMKRYQCLVIGAARGVLTVAITDQQNLSVARLLNKLTGSDIFPVLVEPARMNLLIQRIERYKHEERDILDYTSSLHRLQVHSMVMSLTYIGSKQM